jgi:hypothetical protein
MIRHVLYIISIWIVVLPLVAGLINYKGLNRDSKWIFFMTVAAVPPQILTYFVVFNETKWLNICYNLYTPIEFLLLYGLFYKKYYVRLNRVLLRLSVFVYAGVSLYFVMRYGIKEHFLSRWVCLNNLIYIFWIMTFLKEQYSSESFVIQKRNPFAWYILAFIIYAPCTVLIFCLYYYIRDPQRAELWNLWVIQIICNILLYIFFAVGLFISRKNEINGLHGGEQRQ